MSRSLDPQLFLGFLDEVEGYLPAIRDGLERFRADPSATLALDEPYRFSHSIKGTSSMLGLPELNRLAQLIEEHTEQFADGRLGHDPALLDTLLQAAEHIGEYVRRTHASGDDLIVIPDPAGDLPPEPELDQEPVPEPELEPEISVAIPPELLEVFRLEADDHLRALTSLLPECRKAPSDRDRWAEVRRAAHTLKGAAAMVGFENVTQLSHRMEDLLDLYFEGARTATPDEIDLLLAGTDAIEDMIAGRSDPAHVRTLCSKFTEIVGEAAPAPEVGSAAAGAEAPEESSEHVDRSRVRSEQYVRVPIDRLSEVVKLVGELVIARTAFEQRMNEFARLLGEMEPSTGRLRRAAGKLEAGYEASALLDGTSTATGGCGGGGGWSLTGTDSTGSMEFDYLEMDRYTEFHLLSRELGETTNDIQMVAGELGHLQGEFDGLLTRQARLSSELEDKLMRLRMVPLSSLAARLQRTVRNASQQTGKAVELVLEGERTGLDKTVLEAMADPLLHLLRNAVDHGLETPEARTALGKPASGTIVLRATHEGSQVVLTIRDDGRGIDPDDVRAAIVRRGLRSQEQANRLGSEEAFSYLFQPGFSTKSEVTELSGRGVGLDVVMTTVASLKGTVTISSEVGRGTAFTVRLPMTLAIARALLVRANHQTFAIPLDAVEQIARFEDIEVNQVGGEHWIEVNEKLYPVARLAQVLKLRTPADAPTTRRPIVLLKADGRRVALVIDQLLGGREIVIKNLSGRLRNIPAVSGATLMGDGSVVLILNPSALVKAGSETHAPAPAEPVAPTRARDGVTVLIVDDSPSVRRVLTALVQRVGWRAVAVKDGLEALETLQRGAVSPDVALLDIEMPRMDGYELLATLRGQAAFEKLPVVMITSRAGDKHRQKALDLGANAYLIKPYQDETLIDVVRQLTRAGR